jgi:hypothetical protein
MFFKKIEEQISLYAKSHSGPMFIVFNLSNAHDIDMFGVDYALHGRNIPHFDFDGREIVDRFTSFQTDQEFLNLHDETTNGSNNILI